jgi:transposase InsO family protein
MMLTQEKLDALMIRRGLSQRARAVVERIRSAPPSRRVRSGPGSVACRYPSKKMGHVIQAESHTCELPAIILWEHEQEVYEFYDQCPKISLPYFDRNGVRRGYTTVPDFFVIAENYIGWVECKTESWLHEKIKASNVYAYTDQKWRCPPGEAFAAAYGLNFSVWVDTSVNQIFLANVKFLSDFLDVDAPAVVSQMEKEIYDAFEGANSILLKDLIGTFDGIRSGAIYKLIADRKLFFNWDVDSIAEARFTRIFRDERVMAAYSQIAGTPRTVGASLPAIRTFTLDAGQKLLWDGQPWEVVNAGTESVFIKPASGPILSIPLSDIQNLISDGHISGELVASVDLADEVQRRLLSASASDMDTAIARMDILKALANGTPLKNVPERTLREWRRKQAIAERELGNGVVGLISRIKDRGNRERKISDEVIQLIDAVIDEHLVGESPKSISACYSILLALCDQMGIAGPSIKTFRAEINKKKTIGDRKRAVQGDKGAYQYSEFVHWRLDNAAPVHGQRAFDIAHVDHTQMDLQLVDSVFGKSMGKPWLSVMLDANTRMVLAFVITYERPSYRTCMLLMRDYIRRHRRVPDTIVTDKGSEFEGGFWEILLACLKVTKKTRPSAKGRYGSVIERFFGVANQQFFHQLKGNNLPLQKPRSTSSTHDPRKTAVWTLQEIALSFEDYIENTYSRLEHSRLGVSPREAFDHSLRVTGVRHMRMITESEELAILCLPDVRGGVRRIAHGRGIKVGANFYFNPMFRDAALASTKVPVKYDPFDLGYVYAQVGKEWIRCECPESAQLVGRSETEIQLISHETRARQGAATQRDRGNRVVHGRNLLAVDAKEKLLLHQKKVAEVRAAEDALGIVNLLEGADKEPEEQENKAANPFNVKAGERFGELK